MKSSKALFDTLRSIEASNISGTYSAIGSPFDFEARIICFTNLTQGHMILSTDLNNVKGQIIVPAGAFKLYDISSNFLQDRDDKFTLGKGVQLYVKQLTEPVIGALYLEIIYA